MSVEELFEAQEELKTWANPDTARAWLLRANPVWGRCEDVNDVALFDTREQAKAYIEASQLPEELRGETEDGIYRSHRPDSLLYDYNIELHCAGPKVIPAVPWNLYEDVTRNPEPPSGAFEGWPQLDKPRYGRDCDVGMGGPRTDTSGVVPKMPEKDDAS